MATTTHLARRLVRSFDPRPLSAAALATVTETLSAAEFALWSTMALHDRRHSIDVLARFDRLEPGAPSCERAAVLLHDIGKTDTNLGRLSRVVATILGPRTKRYERYHQHESIGAAMLRDLGSHPRTVELVEGGCDDRTARAMRMADDI